MNFSESMRIESEVVKYYIDRLPDGYRVVKTNQFCPADLVVRKGCNYYCLEVKTRRGHYDLEFMKKNGMVCESYKLKKLNKMYNVNELTLITITSDGYVLKGKATFNTECQNRLSGKQTDFERTDKVNKEFIVIKDFEIVEMDLGA